MCRWRALEALEEALQGRVPAILRLVRQCSCAALEVHGNFNSELTSGPRT